jgi:chromosome segregation ATPase
MTGDEMERAIEFLLQNQARLEERGAQTQQQLSQTQQQLSQTQEQLGQTQEQLGQTQQQLGELNRIVQMQATSQGELNQMLTRAITTLAEAQVRTEAKVDKLAGVVEKLVERLSP